MQKTLFSIISAQHFVRQARLYTRAVRQFWHRLRRQQGPAYCIFVLFLCGLFLGSFQFKVTAQTVASWQSLAPLALKRSDLAAVTGQGYLYALGGSTSTSDSTPTASVERAKINTDGSLGPWQFTTSMQTSRRGLAAVVIGDYLYALGGSTGLATILASVERAKINTDGSLGPWQAAPTMTTARFGLAAVVVGEYVYALGGYSPQSQNSVERARINPDGSLGAWQPATSMSSSRPGLAVVTAGNYLFALGGVGEGATTVERTRVNPNGSLDPWQLISVMTAEHENLAAVIADGYLYALGSYCCAAYSSDQVERAAVNPDGSLGPWQPIVPMPTSRGLLSAVAVNHNIYALGGYSNPQPGGVDLYLATVERLRTDEQTALSSIYLPFIRR